MFSVLFLIVSGMLDLGRVWYIYTALEDAAAEAALYLSINPYCEDSTSTDFEGHPCPDPNNALYRAKHSVGPDIINLDDLRVTYSVSLPGVPVGPGAYRSVGTLVIVHIRYPVDMITPVIPRIAGINPIYLTVQATQTIVSEGEDEGDPTA